MEDYQNYTTEDFVLDPEFKTWVKHPTPESDAFWQEWQQTHPYSRHIVEQAISIIQHFPEEDSAPLSYADRLHMMQSIEAGIDELTTQREKHADTKEGTVVPLKIKGVNPTSGTQINFPTWYWGIAASLLLIAGAGFFLFNSGGIAQKHEALPDIALVQEQNPNGKKSMVLLKDGSRVTLNADSKISYPETFGSSKREVYLEGEAFFEVTKDTARPFEVITGAIKTVALGTSFNIRAYPEAGKIEVALATGKVKIQHDKTLTVLETLVPGEQIIYQKESGALQKEGIRQDDISPWKTGVLQFNHSQEEEVFKALERWYGVQIEMENTSQLPVDVNGKFEDESIDNVLEVLRYSMKFNYEKDQEKITIRYEN